jgi:anti-sigma regulatory factor (Ser/Thr protein kinase)
VTVIDTPVRPALRLPSDPGSAVRARRFAEQVLSDRAVAASADHIDSVALVVSELVTNSVRHGSKAGDDICLALDAAPGRTVVEVYDPAHHRPQLQPKSSARECGRGLLILDAMCPRLWGSRVCESGKCVWAAVLSVADEHLPGERLGVHSYLCEMCRQGRGCPDARWLARSAVHDVR